MGYDVVKPQLYSKMGLDVYTRDASVSEDEETEKVLNRIKALTKVLVVGCGNSPMSVDMYRDGFTQIISTDYSEPVIKFMRDKHPDLQWEVMDCMHLEYPNETFDMVIDKGTMDALLCGNNAFSNVKKMLDEMYRVLKPGGIGIVISYGEPKDRTFHFGARAWRVEHDIVGGTRHLYTAFKAIPPNQTVLTPQMKAEARNIGRSSVIRSSPASSPSSSIINTDMAATAAAAATTSTRRP